MKEPVLIKRQIAPGLDIVVEVTADAAYLEVRNGPERITFVDGEIETLEEFFANLNATIESVQDQLND